MFPHLISFKSLMISYVTIIIKGDNLIDLGVLIMSPYGGPMTIPASIWTLFWRHLCMLLCTFEKQKFMYDQACAWLNWKTMDISKPERNSCWNGNVTMTEMSPRVSNNWQINMIRGRGLCLWEPSDQGTQDLSLNYSFKVGVSVCLNYSKTHKARRHREDRLWPSALQDAN